MEALMWLAFATVVGTGQAQFPSQEHLKQYIIHSQKTAQLNKLLIKTIPDNAFGNYSNITVRETMYVFHDSFQIIWHEEIQFVTTPL